MRPREREGKCVHACTNPCERLVDCKQEIPSAVACVCVCVGGDGECETKYERMIVDKNEM